VEISATFIASLSIQQQADNATAPLAQTTRGGYTFTGGDAEFNLDGSSTPAVTTKPVDLSHTFGSGSPVSKDLTAAPLAENTGDTIDLTGKKLVAILFAAAAANNAGGVTIGAHATNGYNVAGNADTFKIFPGETMVRGVNGVASGFPAVGSGAKIIELTPGASGDVITIKALFA